jgi:hypothetical protein
MDVAVLLQTQRATYVNYDVNCQRGGSLEKGLKFAHNQPGDDDSVTIAVTLFYNICYFPFLFIFDWNLYIVSLYQLIGLVFILILNMMFIITRGK